MGSGAFEIDYNPVTKAPRATGYRQISAEPGHPPSPWRPHPLDQRRDAPPVDHPGGRDPGQRRLYPKGVSVVNVPDMWFMRQGYDPRLRGSDDLRRSGATNDPGAGSQTFYWTNQQSARLMFYHDHAWGITRLNVYAGEAAGYLIQDPVERALVNGGTVGGRTFTAGTIPSDADPPGHPGQDLRGRRHDRRPAQRTRIRPGTGDRRPGRRSPATSGGPMSTCRPRIHLTPT